MRAAVAVAIVFCGSAAFAQPSADLDPRDYAARVTVDYLDGSDRGAGYFENVRVVAEEQLVRRGGSVELVVRGRSEHRAALLDPGSPAGARGASVREFEFEHRWTGDARADGEALILRFLHTTAARPASACDLTLRCGADEHVGDALRCNPTRRIGHFGAERVYPSYLRVPLLLARGRWLAVQASGDDRSGGNARATTVP